MSIRLITAGKAFASVMSGLHGRAFAQPWSEESFANLSEMPGVASFIAIAEPPHPPLPVGFIMHRVAADEAEILTLGVLASYRGGGVGRTLVRAAAEAAWEAGAQRLFLEVAEGNTPARMLYESLSFSCVGCRPDYYDADAAASRDALTLSANLPL